MKTVTDTTKSLAPIKARANKMQAVVNALVVSDGAGLIAAANVRAGIKIVAKQIDEKKKEIIEPLNLALKNVRGLFAPLEEACEAATKTVDAKVIAYNVEIERIRQEAEAKEAAKVERGSIKIETAVKHLEAVPEARRHVDGLTIIKRRNFKVVDLTKLPIEYHFANETKIRIAMYAGTELPGVEYFQDDIIQGR